MSPLLRRLLSPAGFLLVLVLFLLPFVSISCELFGQDIGVHYSGLDVAVNGEPTASGPGSVADLVPQGQREEDPADDAPTTNAQLWAILAAAAALAGVLTVLVSAVRARRIAAAVIAGLGFALLIVMQIVAQANLSAEVWRQVADLGSDLSEVRVDREAVDNAIGWESGFLLALLVLLAIALGNVAALTRHRWRHRLPTVRLRPATSAEPDPPTPPMGLPQQS